MHIMQTKNINVNSGPAAPTLNNQNPEKTSVLGVPPLPPRGLSSLLEQQAAASGSSTAELGGPGPYKPVPPPKPLQPAAPVSAAATTINYQPIAATAGYHPLPPSTLYQSLTASPAYLVASSQPTYQATYQPAPAASTSGAGYQPPPYRMPPYPLYGETTIPGATLVPGDSGPLHTHSSKFPIEREVILSSADKNSKIPILTEYKKRTKSAAAIAPEGPCKSVAWAEDRKPAASEDHLTSVSLHQQLRKDTEMGLDEIGPNHQIYKAHPLQMAVSIGKHPTTPTVQTTNASVELRPSSYRSESSSLYNGIRPAASTGAVPRHSSRRIEDGRNLQFTSQTVPVISSGLLITQQQQQQQPPPVPTSQPPQMTPPDQSKSKEDEAKDSIGDKSKAFPTRTYHTIKDMISSRFSKPGKENDISSSPLHYNNSTPSERISADVLGPTGTYQMSYYAGTPSGSKSIQKQTIQRQASVPALDHEDDDGGFGTLGRDKLRASTGTLNPPTVTISAQPPHLLAESSKHSSGQSSDYEKPPKRVGSGQSSSNADSGRGSTTYGSQPEAKISSQAILDTSTESSDSAGPTGDVGKRRPTGSGIESEWADVETELRHMLDPKHQSSGSGGPSGSGGANGVGKANSTLSESISSLTPPLPPLSPDGASSPSPEPRHSRYKHSQSLPYGSKLEYHPTPITANEKSHKSSTSVSIGMSGSGHKSGVRSGGHRSSGMSKSQQVAAEKQHRQMLMLMAGKKESQGKQLQQQQQQQLAGSVFGADTTDLTSTTTGLDSMLDGPSEMNNSSEDDLSTTIDARDGVAIRRQLEGLENMYSEVLKLLGVKRNGGRYQPSSELRGHRRRLYGSMSSLPSSVSSRQFRDKRRHDDRKKVKDIKGINKRFQRLESHVVTLARSVAHLSSEMRTQHLMIQEMENIRGEISALRAATTGGAAVRSHSVPRLQATTGGGGDPESGLPALTNPTRVKKLTKFFGDEPPLLRLFLKKLGYEKYAASFEHERVGMVELPYLSEERLQKMGIPMGPRLRILHEAQISVCRDKVYVV